MFDIVSPQRISKPGTFAVRIIEPTIFRGSHCDRGAEFFELSSEEFAAMIDSRRAVRIASRQIERAEAAPVVEVPEARVMPNGPSALDARMMPKSEIEAAYGVRMDDSNPGTQEQPADVPPAKSSRKRRAK